MRKLLIPAILSACCLTGCFARHLELDDPLGLPVSRPDLGVRVRSDSALGPRIQQELIALLPRERHVLAHALTAAETDRWRLDGELSVGRQRLNVPVPMFDALGAADKVALELKLTATLTPPAGSPLAPRSWELVQRGEARPEAEARLTQELLRGLRDRLLLELQPTYRYD